MFKVVELNLNGPNPIHTKYTRPIWATLFIGFVHFNNTMLYLLNLNWSKGGKSEKNVYSRVFTSLSIFDQKLL